MTLTTTETGASRGILVEQLNHAQWHVVGPNGRAGGVADYVTAVADALWTGSLCGLRVETLALDWTRLELLRPAVLA